MCRSRGERGVALLWTLAAVMLVAASSLALVRVSVGEKVRRGMAVDAAIALDLLAAAEAPILEWLAVESSRLVLPPDAQVPQATVRHQRLAIGEHEAELRITAFDQDGMVAMRHVAQGGPLRLLVPITARDTVDAAEIVDLPDEALGLDLLDPTSVGAVFPGRWDGGVQTTFRRDGDIDVAVRSVPSLEGSDAFGARLASHNAGRLNVNTAPLEIVEAVYRLTGRGGIEQVARARREGRPVTAAPPSVPQSDAELPALVTASEAFAFRIDLRVGKVRPSWWAVYRKGGERGWTCVQRLEIP